MREKFNKYLWRSLVAVVAVGSLLSLSAPALAATTAPATPVSSGNNGLQISPTRTDLAVDPGDSNSFQVSIKNVSSIALTAKASLNDFESDNTTGIPKLIVDPNQHSPRSISPFLRGLNDVSLQPGQTKLIQLSIDIPKTAAPGGYYGALRFSAVPITPTENVGPEQISLTASVASLVLVEINGPVNEALSFDSLNALRNGTSQAIFFGKGPDQASIRLTNNGNGFSEPIGQVSITKGGKQVYSYQFNTDTAGLHSTILPDSSRTFKDSIKNVNGFGQYKITASIAYKQGAEAITVTQKFWVITKGFELVLLAIVIIIAGGIGLWKLARRTPKNSR